MKQLGWALMDKNTGEIPIWHERETESAYLIKFYKTRAATTGDKGTIWQVVGVTLTWKETKCPKS